MAEPQVSTNGTHQGFPEYPTATPLNTVSTFQPAQSSTPTSATGTEQQGEITKDEVGWFFVEQYYTTMSRNPDKLHLFYSKRSQLIFGTEAETIPVAIGTKAINEKIKNLDFQDCKVRVQNVDSQESFDNILVAVIGEISNKSEPSRKFSQTFVLAEQPNGYYVLNDIFRYLVEEEDETAEETAVEAVSESAPVVESTPAEAEVKTEEVATPEAEVKAEEVKEDEKPEEATPVTNGVPVPETPAPVAVVESEPEPVVAEKPVAKDVSVPEKAAPVEKPASPTPTPATPMSWASIASSKAAAAAAAAAAPKAPVVAPAAAAKATTPATPVASATPAVPAAQPAATSTPVAEKDTSSDSAGWQTAGVDKKTQARAVEEPPVLAFIKNVGEKVDAALLKSVLNRYGKLKYFDVSRGKNCAFVEFADPAGYSAAFAANPVQVGDQQVIVEERRARGAYGTGYTGRGGARGRNDRPGSQGRGGFQRGEGRGGSNPRGRGANGNVAKGRNQPQAA